MTMQLQALAFSRADTTSLYHRMATTTTAIKAEINLSTETDKLTTSNDCRSKTRAVRMSQDHTVSFSQDEDPTDHIDGRLEEEMIPGSQISQVSFSQSLSQTDETIRRLENAGELNQVVGSQSLLSQELISSSQRTDTGDGGFSGFELSQQTETSMAMAQRLGLLTQEEDKPVSDSQTTARSATPEPSAPLTGSQVTSMSDTPIRQSECFGSLLDAVEQITKAEEMNAKYLAWQASGGCSQDQSIATTHTNTNTNTNTNTPQEADTTTSSAAATLPSLTTKSSSPTKRKLEGIKADISKSSSSPKRSRKSSSTRKKEQEQRKAQEIATRAAALAEQTITDPEMAKKLLLSMALVRENPRSIPTELPPRGAVVPEGFFWAHYPPLEGVLKEHMAMYYELSTTKCQSAHQQAFNNELVVLVRAVAKERGWKFHQTFSDKGLRDRIRCYYKTHIQNAKKRLRTMVRNPTKRANARHLCAHLDLIQEHRSKEDASDDGEGSESDATNPQS